jgi:hypothetical protein
MESRIREVEASRVGGVDCVSHLVILFDNYVALNGTCTCSGISY